MIMSSVGIIVLCFVSNKILVDIIFVLVISFPGICVTVVNTAIVNVFPTDLCGIAISITLTAGRLGSITSSSIVGIMLEWSCITTFSLYSASLIGNGWTSCGAWGGFKRGFLLQFVSCWRSCSRNEFSDSVCPQSVNPGKQHLSNGLVWHRRPSCNRPLFVLIVDRTTESELFSRERALIALANCSRDENDALSVFCMYLIMYTSDKNKYFHIEMINTLF